MYWEKWLGHFVTDETLGAETFVPYYVNLHYEYAHGGDDEKYLNRLETFQNFLANQEITYNILNYTDLWDVYRIHNIVTNSDASLVGLVEEFFHECAHVEIAEEYGVRNEVILSMVKTEKTDRLKPLLFVCLNLEDLHRLRSDGKLRDFVGDFLNAPSEIGLDYPLEQDLANLFIGI